jgi:hypothetical protein
VDAIATPFVQGQLRKEKLSFSIQTECAHCARPIHLEMNHELRYQVVEAEADPLVFSPRVDLAALAEPSIIDAF